MITRSELQAVCGTISRFFSVFVAVLIILTIATLMFFDALRYFRESELPGAAPSSGHFVHLRDVDIFVRESGPINAPPVVLFHGTGSWSEIWRDTFPALLEAGYRVIAVDMPPFGYSTKLRGEAQYSREKQAARILELLSAMNLNGATLVAHSIGSRPVVLAALEDPSRIGKLILVAPALGYPKSSEKTFEFQQNEPMWLVKTFFHTPTLRTSILSVYGTNPLSIKKIFSSFVYNTEAITNERVAIIKQPMTQKGTSEAYGDWLSYIATAKDSSPASDFENFKNFRIPVHLIWGDKDTVTPLWAGEKLQSLIPLSEIAVIKDVGHMPYLENVPEFNSILLSFLKK